MVTAPQTPSKLRFYAGSSGVSRWLHRELEFSALFMQGYDEAQAAKVAQMVEDECGKCEKAFAADPSNVEVPSLATLHALSSVPAYLLRYDLPRQNLTTWAQLLLELAMLKVCHLE